jgi:hypothetical protein
MLLEGATRRLAVSRMILDAIRCLTTGSISVTLCGGLVRLIALKIRINFNRHVVDRALEQGQPINPAEIIHASAFRAHSFPSSPEGDQRPAP